MISRNLILASRALFALALLLLNGCATQTSGVRTTVVWREIPLDEALQRARSENRFVLLLLAPSFSGASQRVESRVLADARVVQLVGETVAVRAPAPELGDLVRRFRVRLSPTLILLDGQGVEVDRWGGEQDTRAFRSELEAALRGDPSLVRLRAQAAAGRFDDWLAGVEELARNGRSEAALAECQSLLRQHFSGEGGDSLWAGEGRHRVSFTQVVRAVDRMQAAYPPATAAMEELLPAEREGILAHPESRARGYRFLDVTTALKRDDELLDVYRALPPGEARDILANRAFALFLAKRLYREAAQVRTLDWILERIKKRSDLPLSDRIAFTAIVPPLAGLIIHKAREKRFEERVRYFEAFAGAGRDAEALTIARALLDKRDSPSAVNAIEAAARTARPEDYKTLLAALQLPGPAPRASSR
jgi:hypothetical protein